MENFKIGHSVTRCVSLGCTNIPSAEGKYLFIKNKYCGYRGQIVLKIGLSDFHTVYSKLFNIKDLTETLFFLFELLEHLMSC